MSLLAGKQKTMEPLFGVAAPRSDGTGPPPALGSGTPDKAPELGMDPDLEPDEPDESVANSSSTAEQATSAAVPSGHSTKLSFGSNLELDLNSILSAAEAEDNAAAGGSGKAKSTPGTRVSPRAADLALGGGFSLDDALADAHPFDAAIGSDGGGGGGGGGFAHPFDRGGGGMSHASAKDAAKRRRVRRSMHRPSVSFSDQPGSLEGVRGLFVNPSRRAVAYRTRDVLPVLLAAYCSVVNLDTYFWRCVMRPCFIHSGCDRKSCRPAS